MMWSSSVESRFSTMNMVQNDGNSSLGDDVMEAGLTHKDGLRSVDTDFEVLCKEMKQSASVTKARVRGIYQASRDARARVSVVQLGKDMDTSSKPLDLKRRRADEKAAKKKVKQAKTDAEAKRAGKQVARVARDLLARVLPSSASESKACNPALAVPMQSVVMGALDNGVCDADLTECCGDHVSCSCSAAACFGCVECLFCQ
jgi:hypothetical protein